LLDSLNDNVVERKNFFINRNNELGEQTSTNMPKIMSSDAHMLESIGKNINNNKKITRIKMSELTFEAF